MLDRFLHNRTAMGTTIFLGIIVLLGVLAPWISPHDPYANNIANKFAGFSWEYPLGTDQLGRCILSRMLDGIRPTLGLAALTMLGTIGLGAFMGLCAGYFRGAVDEVIMRIVDVMLSFPSQIMVFAIVALLGVDVRNIILAQVFIKWAWYARMIRTGVIQHRDKNFISFSRVVGWLCVRFASLFGRKNLRQSDGLHFISDSLTQRVRSGNLPLVGNAPTG